MFLKDFVLDKRGYIEEADILILNDKLFEKGTASISRVGSRTFTILEKKINLLTQHLLIIECKLIIKLGSSESLGPELSCITPIIVSQVLY